MAKKMTKRQQGLAINNMGLAWEIATKNFSNCPAYDFEEKIADAVYFLCIAAKDFDPSRGVSFSTFAWVCIWNGLNTNHQFQMRRSKLHHRPITFHPLCDGGYERTENREEALNVIRILNQNARPEQIKLFKLYFIEGLTMVEIAKIQNCSKQAVGHRITKLRKLLRECRDSERQEAA